MGLIQINNLYIFWSRFQIFNNLDISGQPQGIAPTYPLFLYGQPLCVVALEIEAFPLNDPSAQSGLQDLS
jgi:hypothetical protein